MAEDIPLSLRAAMDPPIVEDVRRARELYRHVQPHHLLPKLPDQPNGTGKSDAAAATALRDALEPYVQLASLRCNAQRAFITLIDRESQYFIAEASKSFDNKAKETFEKREKLLWLGGEGVSVSGRLCEMTIQLPPADDPYPLFVVKDLSQDPRFSRLPFVQGDPQFRFYAGTPLTTKRGINIGSLCVMDVEPREDLSQEHTHILGWLAGLVISHLEITREAMEGRRSKLMSNALNVFVDGKSRMIHSSIPRSRVESQQSDETSAERMPSKRPSRTFQTDRKSEEGAHNQETSAARQAGSAADTQQDSDGFHTSTRDRATGTSEPSSEEEDEAVPESHRLTFGRAANILRECFEFEGRDGVSFLEAGNGLTHTTGSGLAVNTDYGIRHGKIIHDGQDDITTSPSYQVGTNTSFDPLVSAFAKQTKNPAPVLAASTKHEPFLRGHYPGDHAALSEIDQDVLRELFKRYPQGKIWVLADGAGASSSEDDQTGEDAHRTSSQPRKQSQRRRVEASVMAKLFPGVKQILFVPLWDAGASCWVSGCFMWSTSETRVFSTATDLGFLSAFCKTIMAECSRLDTLRADKQKADFIGSISHELRSPLHGILAGAEFLTETATSAFQRSLIDTLEACGRTLLDTINHVLDFSKINSLDRNWRNKRQPRKRLADGRTGPGAQMSVKQLPSGAPPLLRLYAVTDIAAVIEEVVEGLSVGQIYSQATDLTDISAGNRGRGAVKGLSTAPRTHGGRQDGNRPTVDAIEVLLDVANENWVFMAQPGAIRRIVMNLFGNSIKYTTSGTIKVELRLESVPGSDPDHAGKIMVLKVSDTGKGISAKFLSSRLFVPFAQENSLAPGTGLGLSIVRSIVTILGGNIDIRSKLGEGTTAQVSLPLMRPPAGSESTQSTPHSTGTVAVRDESVQILRNEAAGCAVAIHGHSKGKLMSASSREYAKVLAGYVRDWYGIGVCDWADRGQANVLIIEERDVFDILHDESKAGLGGGPALIVLCSNATRHSEAEADRSDSEMKGVFEYLSKPCGPYKLARALRICLGRMQLLHYTHVPEFEGSLASTGGEAFKELILPGLGAEEASNPVQANETLSASQITRNAQMAINNRLAVEKHSGSEFPFPSAKSSMVASPLSPDVQNLSKWIEATPGVSLLPDPRDSAPRILLVDDNKINLQLLQTFMHKRKYNFVDSAEDGNVAVNAVKAAKKPYEVIFMDISMPVMNGFDATRAIRSFELDNNHKPSMIIALTGLANSRDQAEGFSAGCDLYMTKPVSLKELGKLLKNWESNMAAIRNPV